jgi:TP901 family phage tail tape measure protein
MVQQFKAGQIVGELILNDKKYRASLNKAGKRADKFEKNSKRRAKGVLNAWTKTFIGIGAGLATVRAFKSIISASADLEQRLANVSTLGNISAETMEMMKDRIKEMSGEVRQLPTDLVEALYDTISAGAKPGAEALKITEQAAKLATAGLTDARTAADALTTVLNAYGKSADDAEQVSDVLFSTVEKGKLRLDDLAQSIGKAIPSSVALGISLEEVSAFLATATKRGFDTAEAVTALRAANTAFVKGAGKFRKAGIDILDVISKKGLLGGLDALQKLTKGNIEAVQEYFPNVRALNGVLLAAGEGANDYADALDSARNAAGKTATATKKQLATQSAGIKELQIALENFKSSLGDQFAAPVNTATSALTKLLNVMTKLVKARTALTAAGIKAPSATTPESSFGTTSQRLTEEDFAEMDAEFQEKRIENAKKVTETLFKQKTEARSSAEVAIASSNSIREAEIRRFENLANSLASAKLHEILLAEERKKEAVRLEAAFQGEAGLLRQSQFELEQKMEAEIRGLEETQAKKEEADLAEEKRVEASDKAFEKRIKQQDRINEGLDKEITKTNKKKDAIITAGFNMKNFGLTTGRSIDMALSGLENVISSTKTMGEVFEQVGKDIIAMFIRMIAKAAIFAGLNAATGGALSAGTGFFGGIGEILGFSRLAPPSVSLGSGVPTLTGEKTPDVSSPQEKVFKFTAGDDLARVIIDAMNIEIEDNKVRSLASELI